MREAQAMHSWLHPNLLRVYGISKEPATGDWLLVMACCECASLQELLSNATVDLDSDLVMSFMSDIAVGEDRPLPH